MSVTLDEQIQCVKRELALRKNVYPKFVETGRMKIKTADDELRRMAAVLNTLIRVQQRLPIDLDEPEKGNEL